MGEVGCFSGDVPFRGVLLLEVPTLSVLVASPAMIRK